MKQVKQPTIANSLREYARGLAGGLMFSLPLLFTMEVWWAGLAAEPMRLLALMAATLLLLLGYNYYAGLHHDACWSEVVIDSIEEMGLGLVVAGALLFLLGQIELDHSVFEAVGKIVVEAMTVAIGISVGTSQLGGKRGHDSKDAGEEMPKGKVTFGGQVVIACCGAVLFSVNVAPTDEVLVIAIESHLAKLVGIVLLSLALTALILYYIEFTGSEKFVLYRDGFVSVAFGTVISYAVALVVSAAVLWFFGRLDDVGLLPSVAQIVVLGLASTLGASAGRLLLQ